MCAYYTYTSNFLYILFVYVFEVNPGIGDEVEIHMRKTQDGRLVTAIGRVTQVDPDHPNRVKTHTCRKNFRKGSFGNYYTSFDVYDFK